MGIGPPYWDTNEERDRILSDRIEAELARPASGMWLRQRQAERIREMVEAAMNGQQAWHEWLVKDGERGAGFWRRTGPLIGSLAFYAALGVSAWQMVR